MAANPTPRKSSQPASKVRHDERGNAIWVTDEESTGETTICRKLGADRFALGDPGGELSLDTGFDPYSHTVNLAPKAAKPKTDLRALSAQILAERAKK